MKRVQRYILERRMRRKWYALFFLCALVFLAGFLIVDYNTSWLVYGYGKINAFSVAATRHYIDMNFLGNDIKISDRAIRTMLNWFNR
ncbi:hypothetical protein [Caldanaerobius polysaccharolyticus]|uniref:hypothetical protein n=1 Tax=Caldanaerobius polysaccharolyticus TaxID=44256 RepID=UPI00047C7A78|nr:hypothetical protein [Caldanaerobius polysaccharolyticus]